MEYYNQQHDLDFSTQINLNVLLDLIFRLRQIMNTVDFQAKTLMEL